MSDDKSVDLRSVDDDAVDDEDDHDRDDLEIFEWNTPKAVIGD